MHDHKNNVKDLCTALEQYNNSIVDLGGKCKSILCYTITALTSGPNGQFNGFVKRYNDDIKAGARPYKDFTWEDVIDGARNKYNNMVLSGT